MNKFLTICLLSLALYVPAQNVGINGTAATPDPSAMLDIAASNKGLLIPRVSLTSTTDVTTIPSPQTSLLVYNTNAAMTGGAVGFYHYDGAAWKGLGGGKEMVWHTSVNSAGGMTQWGGNQTAYPNSPTSSHGAAFEANSQVKMPKCVITRLRVYITINGQNTAGSFTIRRNGVSQAISITVPATTTGVFEATGAIAFAEGDLLSVQAVHGGTGAQGIGILRIEISYY